MARSKREKEVSLTKVKKKTKESKKNLVSDIRRSVNLYKNLFVFNVQNVRTSNFLQVRQKFKNNSRFYFGKNNVMAIALGRSAEDECAKDLSIISRHLKGQSGLLFTNEKKSEVIKFFEKFRLEEFLHAGQIANQTVELSKGPLEQFPFSLEPQLRKLGLQTKLEKGVINLLSDYTVCREGEAVSAEQAKLLRFLDLKLSDFRIFLSVYWSSKTGCEPINC